MRNPSSARLFWPAGLSFRCESCCVRWCAPSVAVCGSLRQWDIRYEEPSGSSACRRSILPTTRPPEIASLVQVLTFRILFGLARSRTVPGRQHDQQKSGRRWLLRLACWPSPFPRLPLGLRRYSRVSRTTSVLTEEFIRHAGLVGACSRCEGAVLADLQCIIACPWAPLHASFPEELDSRCSIDCQARIRERISVPARRANRPQQGKPNCTRLSSALPLRTSGRKLSRL